MECVTTIIESNSNVVLPVLQDLLENGLSFWIEMTPQELEIGKFLASLSIKGRFVKTLSVQFAEPLQVKPLPKQEKLLLFQLKVDAYAKTNYSLMENVIMTIKSSFYAAKMPVR